MTMMLLAADDDADDDYDGGDGETRVMPTLVATLLLGHC